jgi:hypothetical protein
MAGIEYLGKVSEQKPIFKYLAWNKKLNIIKNKNLFLI